MPTIALPHPSAGRLLEWARRPAGTDLLLAFAVTSLGLVTAQRVGPGATLTSAVFLFALPMPVLLLARRRYPIGICAALATGNVLLAAAGSLQAGALVALAVALYTLGAYRELAVAVVTGFGLLFALPVAAWVAARVLLQMYWQEPTPLLVAAMPLFIPLGAGIVTRQYRLSKEPTAREQALRRAGQVETERRVLLEERAAIARDLHDSVAHHVNLMVIQAETGPDLVRRGEDAVLAGFRLIGDTGRRALAELDRTLAALREGAAGPRAPQPRLADLPALVEDTGSQGLAVDLVTRGDVRPADPGVELAAYRIVQESLTNVLRHAEATSATVLVEYARGGIAVQVADRGRGFDPVAGPLDRAGHGLAGMRERARVHGGTLAVASAPGAGTMISTWLPDPEPA
jgi:signal transduction histidine kinase